MLVPHTEVRVVGEPTGRQRISFQASLFGPRPVYEVEHIVAHYTTNPNTPPKVAREWVRVPVWKAYALTFYAGDSV